MPLEQTPDIIAEKAINVSIGTAGVLGLADVVQTDPPTTAYLMLGGQCARDCAFCAQARSSQARANALSRVIWPPMALDETIRRIDDASRAAGLQRACFQVTSAPGYLSRAAELLRAMKERTAIPLSASVAARDLADVEKLLEAGAERLGLALDAATPAIYRTIKGGDWGRACALLLDAAARFPGRISTHLMAGLGETEQEMVALVQRLRDHGVTIGLFAFTPVPGTRLAHHPQPPLAAYRRLQAARFLIVSGASRAEEMRFDDQGCINHLGLPVSALPEALGHAFQTSGCPGCNRPYYNERPGGTLYNYPRPLTREEAARAMADMDLPSR